MSVINKFNLVSPYSPTGDQPEAIAELCSSVNENVKHSTLWGVTGSGKTFTMANVIAQCNRPTLILSHNKTLAAQLYSEFKAFFPENAVEYFVSYYDYYQPEAYIPQTDTYIEKDLSINDEIEKLRLSSAAALLSGRRDVIVVSSVSCIYGIGNPADFHANTTTLVTGDSCNRKKLLENLSAALYSRNDEDFSRGKFRVKGDTIDIYTAYSEAAYRIVFFEDDIESIFIIDPLTGQRIDKVEQVTIYPANNFVTSRHRVKEALGQIKEDLNRQVKIFEEEGRSIEAKRLRNRTDYDLELIKEVGHCPGIENYSRYFDGRSEGSRPFCLIDYFPLDYITFIDESHVTIPQIRGMYGGDASRKNNLVNHGFRLPSARDNRPLKFEEFEALTNQTIYVSATPADYELIKSEGVVIEQFIRPTGLLDPEIFVRPTDNQVDNLVEEIHKNIAVEERVLVTTLTKRMAEELCIYLTKIGIRCRYIHSDIDNMERIATLEDFRKGLYDVLIGVNLLREGLDLPEVSLVAILDADKEGFLRTRRALIQTAGRAARNINGRVIMYADKMTESMVKAIEETESRRSQQMTYNKEHDIVPRQIYKANNRSIITGEILESNNSDVVTYDVPYTLGRGMSLVAEGSAGYEAYDLENLDEQIAIERKAMEDASKVLDFTTATKHRDQMYKLEHIRSKILLNSDR